MSVQMAAFAFGCFLLMVGLVGGGFQVKELKVPKVGRVPRLTSCAFSLVFIFLGIRPDFIGGGPAPAAAEPAPAAAPVVVEKVVPILIQTPAPQQQVLPASQVVPQAAPTGNTERNREARPAAPPQAKKKVPWEQKPRRWLSRLKETPG